MAPVKIFPEPGQFVRIHGSRRNLYVTVMNLVDVLHFRAAFDPRMVSGADSQR